MGFSKNLRNTIQKYHAKDGVPIALSADGAKSLQALIEEAGAKKPLWRRQLAWIFSEIFKEGAWEAVRSHLCVQLRNPLGKKAWIDTDGKTLRELEVISSFAVIFLNMSATNDVLGLMDMHKIPEPEFAFPDRWFSDRIGDPDSPRL